MSKHLQGESAGWHILNAEGKPISGAWQSKADAVIHFARKGAEAVSMVLWSGKYVIVA